MMAGINGGARSNEVRFVPDNRKGLAKPSAFEWMVMVTGVGLCSTGLWGMIVGVPIALAGVYSGFFVPPRVERGLYIGPCPHCGAEMSATHYQDALDCPSCRRPVGVNDGKFVPARGSL